MLPSNDQDTVRPTAATATEIPEFVIGRAYNRREEITGKFGGSGQSGIAPSRQSPAVFLFTGTGEQHGYKDEFDAFGYLYYVGEGQLGDMKMTKGNLAIASHAKDGRALHVFKMRGKGKPCEYLGEFACDSYFFKRDADRNGNERNVIVFRLMPVSNTLRRELDDLPDQDDDNAAKAESQRADLTTLRQAAIAACQPGDPIADPKETVRIAYQRSARVKRYVLARAEGHCELCEAPAPFNRKSDGTPYLEPHHINRLSDGGLDHPKYVGAICPTCHRLIHFGENGQHRNEELRARIAAKEEPFANRTAR
ncbi:HNH endonuclease [Ralstonia mojiangensis]|uniref:HNH endonuclease n=1 Tax=Ralstonia mojiangensis TaxID=2953895 RepID=UPI002091E09C|nr:HNH endonuclease signature motif containing protein [Ralstonia mojiangensis]MCO5411946.1 HNH endonuclease [Ralstonia mojiangensis]